MCVINMNSIKVSVRMMLSQNHHEHLWYRDSIICTRRFGFQTASKNTYRQEVDGQSKVFHLIQV